MPSEKREDSILCWATPEFLQDILSREGDDRKVISVDKNSIKVANKGDHHTSSMLRIKVTLAKNGETQDLQLVIKSLPQNMAKEFAEKVVRGGLFPTEIKMYREIVPRLTKILNRVYPQKDNTITPKLYYSQNSPPYNMVMEDLASRGFRMGDRRKGLDLHHCELVMRRIAQFHAASIILHSQAEHEVEIFNTHPFVKDSSGSFTASREKVFNAIASVVERWPENGKRYADKLREKGKTISADISEVFRKERNKFCVLNHGDLWLNNMMFSYGAENEAKDVKFIDLQLSYYSSPALDLQYFMHTSPTDEVRVLHAGRLLRLYHEELCRTLELLGAEEHAVSYDDFIQDYESKSVYGMFVTFFLLPIALADPKDALSIEGEGATEEAHMKAAQNRFQNEAYTRIIKRRLPEFEEKCLI